jgi:indoleamine 2,3-dioxygenase
MPTTPLTGILKDFRAYRPGNHREFLEWVQQRATAVHLKEFALKRKDSAGEAPPNRKSSKVCPNN